MKNYLKYIVAVSFLGTINTYQAQVRIVNSNVNTAVINMSPFIDASSSNIVNSSTNIGKGLLFPRTDLSTFNAFGGSPAGLPNSFPTRFDGMIVYNTSTSGVAGAGILRVPYHQVIGIMIIKPLLLMVVRGEH